MKKLLTVSLVAMMAVTTARAEIASKAYVDQKDGVLTNLETTDKTNLVAAINEVVGNVSTNAGAIETLNGDENTNGSVAKQIADAVSTGTSKGVTRPNTTDAVGSATQPIFVNSSGVATATNALGSAAWTDSTAYDAAGAATGVKTTVDAYTVNSKAISTNPTLAGSDIAATGYTRASAASAIAATDTMNEALGKLEYKVDTATTAATTAASDSAAGVAKLYAATGQNTDGSMTQKAVTDALGLKANSADLGTAAAANLATNGVAAGESGLVTGAEVNTAIAAATAGLDSSDDADTHEVVTGVALVDGAVSVTSGDPLTTAAYETQASGVDLGDGSYSLTMKVVSGTPTYKWELIERASGE